MRGRELLQGTLLVAAGNLAGASAGLALRAAIGYRFGATGDTDAFVAALQTADAFTVPLAGMVAATFIPVYARLDRQNADEAALVARSVLTLAVAVFGGIAIGVGLLAGPIAAWIVGGAGPGVTARATSIIPVFAATSVCAGAAGVLTALLQAGRQFGRPAVAAPIRALTATLVILIVGARYGIGAAVAGVVLGYVLQVALLSGLAARSLGNSPAIRPGHPAVRETFTAAVPMVVGTFLLQFNGLISVRAAAADAAGSVTAFNFATAIAAQVATLVGASIADAGFPFISRNAGDRPAMRESISLLLRSAALLGAMASAALAACGGAVAQVLFGHGLFAGMAADQTGRLVGFYGIGLMALSLPTLVSRLFYANRDTRTPQALLLPAIVVNLLLAPALGRRFGVAGVAVASLCASGLFVAVMLAVLDFRDGVVDRRKLAGSVAHGSALGLMVYGAMRAALMLASGALPGASLAVQVGRLAVAAVAGVVIAAGYLWWSGQFGLRDRIPGALARIGGGVRNRR